MYCCEIVYGASELGWVYYRYYAVPSPFVKCALGAMSKGQRITVTVMTMVDRQFQTQAGARYVV
jgi:hypothetical protein